MFALHLQFIMTAQEYILSTLEDLSKPVVIEDIGKTPIEEAIYAKVMSKKFRKLKADKEVIKIAKEAIRLAVKEGKPVPINVIFGGNKLWRLEEAPEIDWAELFSIVYFLRWMKSIASVYKPGALLEYYSEDLVLEVLNNQPRSETDRYSETFVQMLEWLKEYLPSGVMVNYRRYRDDYKSLDDFYDELEVAKAKVLKENGGKLPTMTEAQKIATELNVQLKSGQTDDTQWKEKVELVHQAVEQTETVEKYFYDPHYISACPTYYPALIVTGSTKKSLAKFWVGAGALEKTDDSYYELVLTPNQLNSVKFDWESVELDGLNGKNFSRIRVLRRPSKTLA